MVSNKPTVTVAVASAVFDGCVVVGTTVDFDSVGSPVLTTMGMSTGIADGRRLGGTEDAKLGAVEGEPVVGLPAVGALVGNSVAAVGTSVGSTELGDAVGCCKGLALGAMERGSTEGASEGEELGVVLGTAVGRPGHGWPEGLDEGAGVEGAADGATVGCRVLGRCVRGAGVFGAIDGSGTGLADVGVEEGIADGVEVDSRDGNGDGGIVGVFEVGDVEVPAVGSSLGLHINARHDRYLRRYPTVSTCPHKSLMHATKQIVDSGAHPRERTNLHAC